MYERSQNPRIQRRFLVASFSGPALEPCAQRTTRAQARQPVSLVFVSDYAVLASCRLKFGRQMDSGIVFFFSELHDLLYIMQVSTYSEEAWNHRLDRLLCIHWADGVLWKWSSLVCEQPRAPRAPDSAGERTTAHDLLVRSLDETVGGNRRVWICGS